MPDTISPLISRERPSAPSRFTYQSSALLFNLAVAVFITAGVVFGGLFFYNKTLLNTQKKWESDIAKKRDNFNQQGGIGNLIQTSNALNAARDLVSKHVFTSNVFNFLQEAAHTRVKFDTFAFSRDNKKIDLSGIGASYRTIAEQISILESHPQVEKVEFGGLSLNDKGQVNFKLTIFFKPSLLKLRFDQAGS